MKVTWKGEDELHPDGIGPSLAVWCGVRFHKGVPVETDDPRIIMKARNNRFFEISDDEPQKRGPGRPPKQVE